MNPRRPKLPAPPGMCDTHMHFYDTAIPSAPGGPPLPGHYSVPMYRELQKRLGMSRVVVVQANAYQDDNRVALAAMKELGAGCEGGCGGESRSRRCGDRTADQRPGSAGSASSTSPAGP